MQTSLAHVQGALVQTSAHCHTVDCWHAACLPRALTPDCASTGMVAVLESCLAARGATHPW
eukprot:5794838-Alexandrium_andersonii.AAC.1